MSYQFNYTLPALSAGQPKPDPNTPVFASEDGLVASLSGQECIFQIKRTGEPHVMTFQVLQAMDQCREFRTLEEHAARIQSTQPALAGKREDVVRVLDNLVKRGLLISDQRFVEALESAPPLAPAPLRAVFVRACDRPAQLAQLLASLTDYERRFHAGRRYVLLDDSVLQAHIDEQRDLLREFARTTGCKAHYVGQAERAKLVERIVKAVPAAKGTIESLLTRERNSPTQRFGGGRGWNVAMLLSAGARLALLDDDMRLSLRRPPFAVDGLDPNPPVRVEAAFMANMEEAFGYGEEVAQDPFELHLDVCGQAVGVAVRARYPLARSALRGQNLSRLELLSGAPRILATQLATYGSARTSNGLWLYSLEGRSREEFWRERESYIRNTEAQQVWLGVAQARVADTTGFTPFTFDNGSMLPCTNPVGRSEDVLWSALARYVHPDAVVFELPEGIGHVQEAARKRAQITRQALVPGVNRFLGNYVQRQYGLYKAADPGQRLGFFAEVLRDLAGASPKDRIDHLREYLSYVRADLIDRLQHQFESAPKAPVWWQADVRTIVDENAKALLAKSPPRLAEWPEDIDEAGCAKALVGELESMARALEHWPAVWRHAAEAGEKLLGAL